MAKRVIIDTDPGVDDCAAILLGLTTAPPSCWRWQVPNCKSTR